MGRSVIQLTDRPIARTHASNVTMADLNDMLQEFGHLYEQMEAQQAEQRAEQRHDQEAEVENAQREDRERRSRGERPASPGV